MRPSTEGVSELAPNLFVLVSASLSPAVSGFSPDYSFTFLYPRVLLSFPLGTFQRLVRTDQTCQPILQGEKLRHRERRGSCTGLLGGKGGA